MCENQTNKIVDIGCLIYLISENPKDKLTGYIQYIKIMALEFYKELHLNFYQQFSFCWGSLLISYWFDMGIEVGLPPVMVTLERLEDATFEKRKSLFRKKRMWNLVTYKSADS